MISLARAPKSAVNSTVYSSADNPWKKFKEDNVNQWDHRDNFVQDGIEGTFSAVCLAATDTYGKRTDQPKFDQNGEARSFPKVSINSYLESQDFERPYLMMTHRPDGVYLHTGSDLAHWDDGLVVLPFGHYPTLVGDTGCDTRTSEHNKLYYTVTDKSLNVATLYRRCAQVVLE